MAAHEKNQTKISTERANIEVRIARLNEIIECAGRESGSREGAGRESGSEEEGGSGEESSRGRESSSGGREGGAGHNKKKKTQYNSSTRTIIWACLPLAT